jgi:hypothetical protein
MAWTPVASRSGSRTHAPPLPIIGLMAEPVYCYRHFGEVCVKEIAQDFSERKFPRKLIWGWNLSS